MLSIQKTTWRSYRHFVQFCCVPTLPFHAGPCFMTTNKSAFIGYNHAFRNCRLRFRALPELKLMTRRRYLLFLRKNVWSLSRVMVRPEYRLRGIASELLRQTLSRLNRPLVECVTRTPHICSLLSNAGFRCYGWDKKKGYYYYLYSTQLNLSDFVKNFYVLSEKYA